MVWISLCLAFRLFFFKIEMQVGNVKNIYKREYNEEGEVDVPHVF